MKRLVRIRAGPLIRRSGSAFATKRPTMLVAMTIRLMRVSTKAMARTAYKYSTFYLALLFLAMLVDVAVR